MKCHPDDFRPPGLTRSWSRSRPWWPRSVPIRPSSAGRPAPCEALGLRHHALLRALPAAFPLDPGGPSPARQDGRPGSEDSRRERLGYRRGGPRSRDSELTLRLPRALPIAQRDDAGGLPSAKRNAGPLQGRPAARIFPRPLDPDTRARPGQRHRSAWSASTYETASDPDGTPAVLRVDFLRGAASSSPWSGTRHRAAAQRIAAHRQVAALLGLDQDAAAFSRLARRLGLARLVAGRTGLRLTQTPSVLDGLLWCIIGQQINLPFACVLKRRLIENLGTRLPGGLYSLPTPAAIARLDPADMRPWQYSRKPRPST